jgi:hypothetical protein
VTRVCGLSRAVGLRPRAKARFEGESLRASIRRKASRIVSRRSLNRGGGAVLVPRVNRLLVARQVNGSFPPEGAGWVVPATRHETSEVEPFRSGFLQPYGARGVALAAWSIGLCRVCRNGSAEVGDGE